MKKVYFAARMVTILLTYLGFLQANAQPPTISYQEAFKNLTFPVDIVNAHDGTNRLFVAQQGGLIKVWNGIILSDFINLSSIISTDNYERGLLSIAFHPNFNGTTNRYFFVYYTNKNGDVEVSRYQTTEGNPNTGDTSTGTVIITIPHPTYPGHNGGKLNFGPDGYLYFAPGDGGGEYDPPNNAQNGTVLLGKMVRINIDSTGPASHPNYAIPSDNPYVGNDTIADEIWDLGLRNPFRWSFDRTKGDMWIGDVGEATEEEIDYRPADSTGHNNFGWRCYEGSIPTPGIGPCSPNPPVNYVPPVFTYRRPTNSTAAVAIVGGYVYRGAEYPNLYGYYVATELYSGKIFLLRSNGSGGFDTSTQQGPKYSITSFGEGEDGTLYGISDASNTAFKLVATGGVLPVVLNHFSVEHFSDYNEVRWATVNELDIKRFYIEYSIDGNFYARVGQVAASGNAKGNSYVFQHRLTTTVTTFYRLAIEDNNGRVTYSSIVKVSPYTNSDIEIYPTVIQNRTFTISLHKPAIKLQLFCASGAVVFEKNLKDISGTISLFLPPLAKGLYFVQVISESGVKRKKVIVE